jgi:hypothetical protein
MAKAEKLIKNLKSDLKGVLHDNYIDAVVSDINDIVLETRNDTLIALRDSIQPDGMINSDAGVKTIKAITNAINRAIETPQK